MSFRLVVYFIFELCGYHRDLHLLTHSFPTRRSSDLVLGYSCHIFSSEPDKSASRVATYQRRCAGSSVVPVSASTCSKYSSSFALIGTSPMSMRYPGSCHHGKKWKR